MNGIYRGRNATEFYLASVLYDSIEDLNRSGVARLIKEKGADANIVLPVRGIAPFHQVVAAEDRRFAYETTVLVLQHGGDPNLRSDEGLTPLHVAAAWGRHDLVDLLLRSGADPNLQDNVYMMPIDYAKEHEHHDVVQLIRMFVDDGVRALFDDRSTREICVLTLDKILVVCGETVGEYEIKSEPLRQEPIDLKILPQANPNEYVRNWCNTLEEQLENLSLSPSECSVRSTLPTFEHVTMRRPVINLDDTQSSAMYSSSDTSPPDAKRAVAKTLEHSQSHCSEVSRESGVQTLPNSLHEEFETAGVFKMPLPVTQSTPPLQRKSSKDTSSDYFTCTEISESIGEHDNAFMLSKITDMDASFVSVAEVYKYVDPEQGVCLYEKRVLPTPVPSLNESGENFTVSSKSSKVSSLPVSFDYDTDSLRRELTRVGFEAGPITKTTKRVYLRKLHHLQRHPQEAVIPAGNTNKVYSNAVQKTLKNPMWTADLTPYRVLEEKLVQQFGTPDPSRRWREGVSKASFTYLLLDPRITRNLPGRADQLSPGEQWETFLASIFYVGKGKRSRPYHHLYEAINLHAAGKRETVNRKLQRILDIWGEGQGVVCLHVFQNVIPVEAFTREAAMISALKLSNVENIRAGDFYGIAVTWTLSEKQMLGVYLLYKALKILLQEGERQLSPNDID